MPQAPPPLDVVTPHPPPPHFFFPPPTSPTCRDQREVEQGVAREQGEEVDGLAIAALGEQPGVELANVCTHARGGGVVSSRLMQP